MTTVLIRLEDIIKLLFDNNVNVVFKNGDNIVSNLNHSQLERVNFFKEESKIYTNDFKDYVIEFCFEDGSPDGKVFDGCAIVSDKINCKTIKLKDEDLQDNVKRFYLDYKDFFDHSISERLTKGLNDGKS